MHTSNGDRAGQLALTDGDLDRLRMDGVFLRTIVSQQIKLKREGDHWKGCCPFHDDRTPSFTVFEDGHFYCFGCHVGGTVFDFVMQRDRVDFPEAVIRVAGGLRRSAYGPEPNTKVTDAH